MFVEDKPRAVREMYRVLSHGGRMVITVWGTRAGTPHENLLAEVFREALRYTTPVRYDDWLRHRVRNVFYLPLIPLRDQL